MLDPEARELVKRFVVCMERIAQCADTLDMALVDMRRTKNKEERAKARKARLRRKAKRDKERGTQ